MYVVFGESHVNAVTKKYRSVIVIFIAIITISAATYVAWWGITRFESRRNSNRYLIMTAASPGKNLVAQPGLGDGRVSFIRSDELFATQMLKYFHLTVGDVHKHGYLLLIEAKDQSYSYSFDPKAVFEALSIGRRDEETAEVPAIPLGAVVGVLAAVLLLRYSWVVNVGLALAYAASAYKYANGCPVCPKVLIFGIDAALLGTILYGALLIANFTGSARIFIRLTLCASGTAVAWQFFMFLQSQMTCVPCSIIAGANSAILVAVALKPDDVGQKFIRHSWQSYATSAAVIVCGAGYAFFTPQQAATSAVLASTHAPLSLVGLSIKDIGLPLEPGKSQVIAIVEKGCGACDAARTALRSASGLPLRYVNLRLPGAEPDPIFENISYEKGMVRATPTILVTNGNGLIINQITGWASGPEWAQSQISSIRFDLATRARSGPRKLAGGS